MIEAVMSKRRILEIYLNIIEWGPQLRDDRNRLLGYVFLTDGGFVNEAVLKAGLPQSVGAVTLSKMCGAGMEATILAHDQLIVPAPGLTAHQRSA